MMVNETSRPFDPLCKAFSTIGGPVYEQVLTNKTLKQSPTYLMSIKKCEYKHLRDFVKMFNATTMVTKDVAEEFVVQAFMSEINCQFLKYNLIDKPPANFSALYEKAHIFAESDELEKVKM
ncbi:hypothetical protein J1N35_040145 [Gossypium stocksii]|uniref:Uncharacterized protein n=1 Tax=Gossypium stocksii TaxID=47602 RepID=A0A9D3UD40_9ROSI|nr:hypothetical protein J1N35_040145 [Gossypium stocksii]